MKLKPKKLKLWRTKGMSNDGFRIIKHLEGIEIEERAEKVFSKSNQALETFLKCFEDGGFGSDCLSCGNEECFKAFSELCELRGETLEEAVEDMRRLEEEGKKAVEAQKARFEAYATKVTSKPIWRLKKQDGNLFNRSDGKAA